MFYNGFYRIMHRAIICIFLTYMYVNASIGLVWTSLGKLTLNDSLLVLYLLASSVATLWVFFLFVNFSVIFKYNMTSSFSLFFWVLIVYLGVYSDSIAFVSQFFKLSSVNVTLQNGIVNIHPVIIYYFYAFLILLSVLLLNQINVKQFYFFSTTKLYFFTNLLLLGVLLGSLWAVQELNWGGLWSWDPVEILSIILALYLLKILHNPAGYLEKNYAITWLLLTGAIVLLILRVGVLTTIHSFVKGNANPTHIKWCMLLVVCLCCIITGRDVIVNIFYDSKRNYASGFHLHSYALLLIYLYVVYLFLSVNTNIWKYITLDISNFSCIVITVYCFYKITCTCNVGLKSWFYTFVLIYLLLFVFNYKTIMLLLLAIAICLSDKFVLRFKMLHKYITTLYILVFCILVNTLLQVTPVKVTHCPALCLNSSGFVEASANLYEIFAYLDRQIIITRLKSVIAHIQGFNIYSNGIMTVFSFSKNQSIFYLFGIEYVSNLIIYIFILGCWILNHKQSFFSSVKTY